MRIAARTDVGKVRLENQDDYRASIQEECNAWIAVCDGMGGANGGSVASELAVTCVEEICTKVRLSSLFKEESKALCEKLIAESNACVYEASLSEPSLRGMGTTAVYAVVTGKQCCLTWVGDSRAYLWRNNSLSKITTDHSMVQEMVDKGMLTVEEAEKHPQKNVITRAVGIHPQIEADTIQFELQGEDILLVCTDGLTNALKSVQIEEILRSVPFYEVPEQLIDAVLAQDEQDNTTVVLLSMK